jgi:hypothetical protein
MNPSSKRLRVTLAMQYVPFRADTAPRQLAATQVAHAAQRFGMDLRLH